MTRILPHGGLAHTFDRLEPRIRPVRDRIERVAATDFAVLIEGGSSPQPHPSFVEVFGEAAVN